MDEKTMQSVMFEGIVAKMHNLRDKNGDRMFNNDEIWSAYQERRTDRFPHNYERNKFLRTRDRYELAKKNNKILVKYNKTRVVIYRNNLIDYFNNDRAVDVLYRMLEKLYHKITVEDVCDIRIVDTSNSLSPNNIEVYHDN